ncbi:hypothetical protein PVK06_013971 [Gossypium arboreum]|uniref:Zinc knuckle CX2CX4HX4C domain-containing protein n=1 Tax=Gossypium arboreum TaxID=29729 RepID=A0ABR0PTR5_GOSAR|nr:hypothetical protein PVK06_013971 [Gossypium arboreum]
MEDSVAGLSLDDEEDEVIQLEVEETSKEISYVNCLVGVFLTSSVVHFQAMRSTLAKRVIKNGPWNFNSYLLILHRLKLGEDPLVKATKEKGEDCVEKWKKIVLKNGKSVYVRFEYKKLTLFCFLCERLGHRESFCPTRVTQPQSEYVFNRDISLRTQSRRNQSWKSRWLMKDDREKSPIFGNPMLMGERRNEGILNPNLGQINEDFDKEIVAYEEASSPIVYSDGLKRPRVQKNIQSAGLTKQTTHNQDLLPEMRRIWRHFHSCQIQFIACEDDQAAHTMAVEDAPLKAVEVVDSDRRSSRPP